MNHKALFKKKIKHDIFFKAVGQYVFRSDDAHRDKQKTYLNQNSQRPKESDSFEKNQDIT